VHHPGVNTVIKWYKLQTINGEVTMKTRERLLFMALGGLLVLADMIVGQFVFSPVQAQVSAQDATFKKVRCEELIVGNTSKAVVVYVNYTG